MSIALVFSILGMVVAFLISVLGSLPVSGDPSAAAGTTDESFQIEQVHQAAGLFSNVYTSMIDEMISYQKDPDYQRAESRRREIAEAGAALVGEFQDFEGRLTGMLGELTIEQDEAPATPSP